MAEDISVEEREPKPVVSTRFECLAETMGDHLETMLPPVYAYIDAQGGEVSGPPFLRYHAVFDGRFHLELGFPVVEPIEGKAMMECNELPGGPAVVADHTGPYGELGKTHGKIRNWIRESDWKPAGACWDFYLDDPRDPDSELEEGGRRTKVCYPVKKVESDDE